MILSFVQIAGSIGMNEEGHHEYFKVPVFKTDLKSSTIYWLVLPPLLVILWFALLSTKETLWPLLLAGIFSGLLIYFWTSLNIPIFTLFKDSIEIQYPYFPFTPKTRIPFKSIQGVLFDSSRSRNGLPNKYGSDWIAIYYLDKNGNKKMKKFSYRFISKGDLRKVVSLLRESNVRVKSDEEYLHLT